MKELFLLIGVCLLVATIVTYLWNIDRAGVTPNPATFLIRAVIAVANCYSYFFVVGQNYWMASITVISALGLTTIFIYALIRGKFSKISWVDIICAVVGLLVIVIWKISNNPILANILLQSIMLLAFYPAILAVMEGRAKEKYFPWILATLCYVAMTAAILVDWNGSIYVLVHPIVSGIAGNGALAAVIMWQRKKTEHS